MSALRPLPPRLNLEFEHKEAKALHRRLRAGDPESLERARARHSRIGAIGPVDIKLSDAQLVIAREYGFTSWPRLVRYFEDVERQRHNYRSVKAGKPDFYEGRVRWLRRDAEKKEEWVARTLAAYVPRFYGLPIADVFNESITEDDARLAIARSEGISSWEVLLERVREGNGPSLDSRSPWETDPMRLAGNAMRAADLPELKRVVATHPQLLRPTPVEHAKGYNLVYSAIGAERKLGRDAMRPILEWLESQGYDIQRESNLLLRGHPVTDAEEVAYLLERGADPDWIAPNGFSMLEHALLRYHDGKIVDLMVPYATPRKALWIAAGLGDVDGVRRFLDRDGKPTQEARRFRPDFAAITPFSGPQHPEPSDEEILTEAFYVAMLNQRTAVIEYLASRGCPMNELMWGMTVVAYAVSQGSVPTVECLVRCGADVTLSGWKPGYSAAELTREMFIQRPTDEKMRRISELCGLNPDALLAEVDAKRGPAGVDPKLQEALELAGDDAFRLGQSEIGPENLLIGLLRAGDRAMYWFARVSGIDAERFHAEWASRVRPAEDRVERPKLPMSSASGAVIKSAIDEANTRRRETVDGVHVLFGLVASEQGAVAELLTRYGSSAAALRERLQDTL